ncbi:MAG: Putative Zn-dependent hydrolase [Thermoanaerobacterales bacterium 50_218]|nr:MAG: Putative Zn-dependent hydrolase [Thermoanaerobacterales bacterium 50_218]HAA89182.1 MBL fold metallo-hydrolase [Peptococcaceae bacterium]
MRVRWYGHACFCCEGGGVRLLTDPFSKEVGYPIPQETVDIVTVSHDHYDHNAVDLVPGSPVVVREPGKREVKGIPIKGISVFHDEVRGAKRGKNIVFVWEMEGLRLCHLGDLGHILEPVTVSEIGKVDLLFIPVGGIYTIDAKTAAKVVDQLQPRLVVPMHYKTPALTFELAPVDEFLRYYENIRREKVLVCDAENLPENQEVIVLDYKA